MAKLDTYTALFNRHINNAGERAMSVLEEYFPPSWTTEIRAFEAAGIMSIFDQPELSPAIAAYLALVTAFVNKSENV